MNANPVNRVFRLILGLTYILMGVMIYIKDVLPAPWSLILALAFSLYGSWRILRTFQIKRQDDI